MLEAICRRAFFKFEIPLRYRPVPPRIDGTLSDWDESFLLPPLIEIEDDVAHTDVFAAWNEDWFAIAFQSPERSGPPHCQPDNWWKGDGYRICIDTRDARENKRATRYCHFFYALPVGGGKNKRQPIIDLHTMSRAKESPPTIDASQIQIATHIEKQYLATEILIPATCLQGWDPSQYPRIGLFYKVKDTSAGPQHLTVDDELGWNVDPSTWATAVLIP